MGIGRSLWVAGAGAVSGLLLGAAGIFAWQVAVDMWALDLLDEQCEVDPTVTGLQGYCVQTRHRDAGVFTAEVTSLYFVPVDDSQSHPRVMVAPFPFNDPHTTYDVTFNDGSISVTDGTITATYPESWYADVE